MRHIASNMTSLSVILEDVADIVNVAKDKSVYKQRALQEIENILARFKNVQMEVNEIVDNEVRNIRGKFRWTLKAGKVSELLIEMEGLKSGLQLVLSIVRFAMDRKTSASDSNR